MGFHEGCMVKKKKKRKKKERKPNKQKQKPSKLERKTSMNMVGLCRVIRAMHCLAEGHRNGR
jgi:hypothetical protein